MGYVVEETVYSCGHVVRCDHAKQIYKENSKSPTKCFFLKSEAPLKSERRRDSAEWPKSKNKKVLEVLVGKTNKYLCFMCLLRSEAFLTKP